jgi:hypothetical protein
VSKSVYHLIRSPIAPDLTELALAVCADGLISNSPSQMLVQDREISGDVPVLHSGLVNCALFVKTDL